MCARLEREEFAPESGRVDCEGSAGGSPKGEALGKEGVVGLRGRGYGVGLVTLLLLLLPTLFIALVAWRRGRRRNGAGAGAGPLLWSGWIMIGSLQVPCREVLGGGKGNVFMKRVEKAPSSVASRG